MIYFAQLPTGAIKIGVTEDIGQRVPVLTSYYNAEPAVLHTMDGDRETERDIHRRFAHLRIGKTEQFRPGQDLLAFIGMPVLAHPNPEAVAAHPNRLDGTKPIRLDLNEDDHDTLRVVAAKARMSMAAYVRGLVMKAIEAERRGGK